MSAYARTRTSTHTHMHMRAHTIPMSEQRFVFSDNDQNTVIFADGGTKNITNLGLQLLFLEFPFIFTWFLTGCPRRETLAYTVSRARTSLHLCYRAFACALGKIAFLHGLWNFLQVLWQTFWGPSKDDGERVQRFQARKDNYKAKFYALLLVMICLVYAFLDLCELSWGGISDWSYWFSS